MRRATPLVLAAAFAIVPSTAAAARVEPSAAPAQELAPARVSIFYYPWWGTADRDGAFYHWGRNGSAPPRTIASSYFPARGVYSSGDAVVVAAQMQEIRAAGVDEVSVSWWGRGSREDSHLPGIVAAARAAGLDVAVHIEPYYNRSMGSTRGDITYLAELGITDFYVYGPEDVPPEDWAVMNAGLTAGVRVFAQTTLVGWAAAGGFAGVYTYDVLVYSGRSFARICAQARRVGLLCAPSVGPGFDARRAGGHDRRVRPRRHGRTYDAMWAFALAAAPDVVTITSYNEWHEGTQIEPARARKGFGGYDGAWGLTGRAAERAYLTRTAFWAVRLS